MNVEARAPSVYQKANGAWVIDYECPDTLRRRRRQVKNKRDAFILRDEIARHIANGTLESKKVVLLGEAMMRHIDECPDTKVRTVAHRFSSFYNHFKAWDIRKVSTDDLRHWMDHVLTAAHNKSSGGHVGLSDKSKKKVRDQVVNIFFKWAVAKKLVANNPCLGLKYKEDLHARRRPLVYYTTDELRIIMAKLKEFSPNDLYPVSMTQLHTGSRLGETTHLEWDDIDFAAKKIRFRKTKNGKTELVSMSPQLVELFSSMPRKCNWVYVGPRGNRMTENAVNNLIKRFRLYFPYHEQHGDQKKFGNHCLRHSFAYNSLQAGRPMYEIQKVMRHSSIKLTVDLYGHFEPHANANPSPYDF